MQKSEVGVHEYAKFGQFLEQQCGIVLGDNKHYLLRSRLMPIVREFEFEDLTSLVNSVVNGGNRDLKETVVDAMTTNETLWFRDAYPFELLSHSLFDQYSTTGQPLRIWSAACSSGQEPYSVAMAYDEYKQANPGTCLGGIQITATDLSKEMLSRASKGEYDELSLARGLSDERRKRFFNKTPNGDWQVAEKLRASVTFKQFNLLEPFIGLGKFDVIFCRNVLIYFSADVKRKILQQIAASLQKDGILFLGASESISGISQEFELVRCSPGLYYRKKNP